MTVPVVDARGSPGSAGGREEDAVDRRRLVRPRVAGDQRAQLARRRSMSRNIHAHARSERRLERPCVGRSSRIVHRRGSSVLTLEARALVRSACHDQHRHQDRHRHRRQLGHRARTPPSGSRERGGGVILTYNSQSRRGGRDRRDDRGSAAARPSRSKLDVGDIETFDALRASRGRRARRPLAAHLVRLPRQQRRLRRDVDVRRHHRGALRPRSTGSSSRARSSSPRSCCRCSPTAARSSTRPATRRCPPASRPATPPTRA